MRRLSWIPILFLTTVSASSAELSLLGGYRFGGPPVAVRKFASPTFPQSFSVTSANTMLKGMPFAGPFDIQVRLDQDGNAMTKSAGDLVATSPAKGIKPGDPRARELPPKHLGVRVAREEPREQEQRPEPDRQPAPEERLARGLAERLLGRPDPPESLGDPVSPVADEPESHARRQKDECDQSREQIEHHG